MITDNQRWQRWRDYHAMTPTERIHAVLALYRAGVTVNEIAHRFGVNRQRVYRMLREYEGAL